MTDPKTGLPYGQPLGADASRLKTRRNKEGIMDRFWMVHVEGTGGPKHHHSIEKLANEEAERLSRQEVNRYKKVFVMECKRFCQALEVPVVWDVLEEHRDPTEGSGP